MVSTCANPTCCKPFRYLRGGRLVLLEVAALAPAASSPIGPQSRKREYFWLCEQCAPTTTITTDHNGNPILSSAPAVPLEQAC
jgi:hypothetical protein